jgi:hypothetical protein
VTVKLDPSLEIGEGSALRAPPAVTMSISTTRLPKDPIGAVVPFTVASQYFFQVNESRAGLPTMKRLFWSWRS